MSAKKPTTTTTTTRPIFPVPASPISTPRLLLRPYLPTDLPQFFTLRTQPEVMRWTSTKQTDRDLERTREWMSRGLPPQNASTYSFAIEEAANPGVLVGAIGTTGPVDTPECGYMLRKEVWGKGYATEALRAFLSAYWALERREVTVVGDGEGAGAKTAEEDELEMLLGVTDLDNAASRNVLTKCGFWEVRVFDDHGDPVVEYVCPRPLPPT